MAIKRLTFLLFFMFVCSCKLLFAQNDSARVEKGVYGSVSGGVAFSPRTFFYKSSNTYWRDYVMTGYCSMVSAEIPVFHARKMTVGISALFGYYRNNFNMNKYVGHLQATDTNRYNSYTAGQYGEFTQYSYTAGLYGAFKSGKNTAELNLMAGAGSAVLPNAAYLVTTTYFFKITQPYTQTYVTYLGLAFDGGITVSYKLSRRISILYNTEILYSSIKYDNIVYVGNNARSINNPSGIAAMIMCNASLGVRYLFSKD